MNRKDYTYIYLSTVTIVLIHGLVLLIMSKPVNYMQERLAACTAGSFNSKSVCEMSYTYFHYSYLHT